MRFLALLCVLWCASGCTITEINRVDTGLFEGDLKKLSDAFKQVEEMPVGVTKRGEIEERTGIRFDAPNVERVPGPAAFRRIFNESVFQSALANPANAPKLLLEMQPYTAYFIPFRNVTTYTDRWYFSTKETLKQGDDLLIMILFKSDVLFYSDYRYVKIDSKESTHAFAQGVLDIIKEFLGPADAMYDLINKLEDDYKKKDNE